MSTPNRAELARMGLFWDQVAEDARRRAREIREQLTADARAELERDGTAPTWRIPGVGTVPLCLTTAAVEVADPVMYTKWVAQRHPEHIEKVERIRPAFDEHLRKTLVARGDPPCTDDGELVPGLRYRAGGEAKSIQIRPDATAKAAAAADAAACLDLLEAQPDGTS